MSRSAKHLDARARKDFAPERERFSDRAESLLAVRYRDRRSKPSKLLDAAHLCEEREVAPRDFVVGLGERSRKVARARATPAQRLVRYPTPHGTGERRVVSAPPEVARREQAEVARHVSERVYKHDALRDLRRQPLRRQHREGRAAAVAHKRCAPCACRSNAFNYLFDNRADRPLARRGRCAVARQVRRVERRARGDARCERRKRASVAAPSVQREINSSARTVSLKVHDERILSATSRPDSTTIGIPVPGVVLAPT